MQRDHRTERIKARTKKDAGRRRSSPPYGVIGRYYDELPSRTKYLYWKYFYDGAFTTKQAEAIELRHGGGTLHFKCRLRTGNVPEELQDTLGEIDALMSKI